MKPFELLVLDCDGVLVDSERIANRVLSGMLRELGLPIRGEDMYEYFVGHTWARCRNIISDLLGHAPPAGFDVQYRARRRAVLGITGLVPRFENRYFGLPDLIAAAMDR